MFRFVPAFLTVLFVLARGEDIEEDEGVMVLTDDNFDSAVENNKFLLVEFYAPWCGHCKALAPEYVKAAEKLQGKKSEAKLAKVDATIHSKVAEKYKVQGYPTLKFFKNGVPLEYQGGRTASEIVIWLDKRTGPATTDLATKEAADKFIAGSDVVIVGYFTNADSDEAKAYLAAADGIDDAPFGTITDGTVAEELKIKENSVVIFKKAGVVFTYPGKISHRSQFKAWIMNLTWVPMRELNEKSAPKIFGGSITTHNILFIRKSADDFQTIYDAFKTAAVEFKGQTLFIYIDADTEENSRVMEFFGLDAKDCPDYRVIKMDDDMAKFKPPTKDMDAESIIAFTRKVAAGEVSRHLNSQEIPDDWDKNPVQVLVGKNFRDIAFDAKKKVFVEFYAPWCGHCKQLAPIWDKLGEAYKDQEDIVIAKMDSTSNEIEEVKVTGFPTLKYFPDDKEENVIDYNGERTFDALKKFIDSDGKEIVPRKESDKPEMPDFEAYMDKEFSAAIHEKAQVLEVGDGVKEKELSKDATKELLETAKSRTDSDATEKQQLKNKVEVTTEPETPESKKSPEYEKEKLNAEDQVSAQSTQKESPKEHTAEKNTAEPQVTRKIDSEKAQSETTTEKTTRRTSSKPKLDLPKMDFESITEQLSKDLPKFEDMKPGRKPTPEEIEAAQNDPNNPFKNMSPEERQKKMDEMEVEFQKMHKELEEAMKKLHDPTEFLASLNEILPDPNPTGIPGLDVPVDVQEKLDEDAKNEQQDTQEDVNEKKQTHEEL